MAAPSPDQIEVSVIGPGYGESILVHIGSNRWIVVDSCINSATKTSAAIVYLERLGLNPAECVKLIVATHWHDDHIRGMSQLVAACTSAKFCLAAAVTTKEFLEALESYDERHGIVAGSGTSEICATLKFVRENRRKAARVVANTRIFMEDAENLAHGGQCEVWGLSPSTAQFELSLREIGNLVPRLDELRRRAPDQGCNDLSIATWISIGETSILLGADLEERNKPDLGWSAIVDLDGRPKGRASFFKIPHHGSSNGHCEGVWSDLLIERPTTALTPWNRGSGLPRQSDLERIRRYSDAAFSSSTFKSMPGQRRIPAVEKQLRETGYKIKTDILRTGHIRFRNGGPSNTNTWCVETLDGSCHLDDLAAA